jgi:exodeoxyribonuclease-3
MKLRLATWNINSVRLRLPLAARLIAETRPDVLCLQEIKATGEQFPFEAFQALGYEHVAVNGQKGYHGVAILSRRPLDGIYRLHIGGNEEARHVAAGIAGASLGGEPLLLHNFYVPAGGDIPDPDENPKFRHKIDYLAEMAGYFGSDRDLAGRPMILVGDLNVAPHENDVWSHKSMQKIVSHTPIEVAALEAVQRSLGWVDAMRVGVSDAEKVYTWWSYRAKDWRATNRGRRLDHVWLSPPLAERSHTTTILRDARDWPQASDHVPVVFDIELD